MTAESPSGRNNGTDGTNGTDVADVIDRELRLLHPTVRRSPAEVDRLLHPDFVEFGASGRRWERAAMIAALADEPTDRPEPDVTAPQGVQLADDVVHITYQTARAGRWVWRSSLWRRVDGDWLLYFHQGTPQR